MLHLQFFKDNRGVTLEPTWKQIEPRAPAMGDNRLFRKVQRQDLFVREAKYHSSCRKAFNLRYINHLRDTNSKKEGPPTEQEQKTLAHQKALDVVIHYIQESVIPQEEVVELRALRLLYVKELDKNDFPSPDYRSENLKAKLQKHEIGELIEFTKVNPGDYKNCIMLTLEYSAGISRADAVAHTYKLGTIDRYQDVALLLR